MILPAIILFSALRLSDACADGMAGEDCFFYDTVIGRGAGNGAGKVEGVDSTFDCQLECQMDDDCNWWIWNSPDHNNPNVCWLKKGYTDPSVGGNKQTNRISGPKYCDCFIHNEAIKSGGGNGAGVGRVDEVFSALDCQIQCQMEEECNAFIWNDAEHRKNPNTCWMKKGWGKGMKAKDHRHSGPKFCGELAM